MGRARQGKVQAADVIVNTSNIRFWNQLEIANRETPKSRPDV